MGPAGRERFEMTHRELGNVANWFLEMEAHGDGDLVEGLQLSQTV